MTWLFDRYLEEIRSQGEALLGAAVGRFDAAVPCCPGWEVRDAVAHTGVVHRHKERMVRERLVDGSPEPESSPDTDDVLLAWYAEGLEMLLATLAATDPATPIFTWHSADQTAGFWYRRMAHETAVHRADIESAAAPISPWAPDLAADGVEELLGPIMCAYTDEPRWEYVPDGRVVALRTTDERGDHPDPVSVLTAPAWDLDLWAWGRLPATVLRVEGDASVVDLIRSVAAAATRQARPGWQAVDRASRVENFVRSREFRVQKSETRSQR